MFVHKNPDRTPKFTDIRDRPGEPTYPRDEIGLRDKPETTMSLSGVSPTPSDEPNCVTNRFEKPQTTAQSDTAASDIEGCRSNRIEQADAPNDIYNNFSHTRKVVMVITVAWCGLLSPISSTTVLAAIPEVAASLDVTGSTIGISNALYIVCMAMSPCFWGPMSQVYGRRKCSILTSIIYFLCSIGTALSPNITSFMIFRMATAFAGTAFLVLGPAVIGDLYEPSERGTAMGWFLSGTLIGPTIGPLAGGIMVTYTSWRAIFWLQTALAACSIVGTYFLLCETIHHSSEAQLRGLPLKQKLGVLWGYTNPYRVLQLFRCPSLILVALASGSLVWTQYGLLTPIRYVINPRFSLDTPLQSGLFYLAPGLGYLVGTLGGGRWADYVVKLCIRRRKGRRFAEDRLYSCLPFLGVLMPAEILVYGWCVEKDVGGIAVAIIFMFLQGISQSFAFPCLNVYCLDLCQARGAEIIAGNFLVRYLIGAVCSTSVVTATEVIGVGIFNTISAAFLVAATIGLCVVIRMGSKWESSIDGRGERPSEDRANSFA